MAVNLAPIGNDAPYVDSNGDPFVGANLYTYVAGSSTPAVTYTSATGLVQNDNPMPLNAGGYPTTSSTQTQIWLTAGVTYKFELKNPGGSTIWTRDNIDGINDTTTSQDQWVEGPAPTFVSTTSFSLVGDQTTTFQVGRRVKTTNSGGTIYSTISASAFGAVTTVTVVNDSGVLDSGLTAVSYGLLSKTNDSLPRGIFPLVSENKGYIFGLTLSTAGSSTTMSVAAGTATDSTGASMMVLASAIAKTTGAWAVGTGNGGKLSAAAIANATWYHFFEIKRVDTGVVDVGFDLSPTAPTMPANYTLFRRIGSGLTNGSAQWVSFTQDGNLFQLSVPVLETTSANPGTNAVTQTLANVPTGVNVFALMNVTGSGSFIAYLSDLATTDAAPSATIAPLATTGGGGVATFGAQAWVRTNTSAQIRTRISASGGGQQLFIATLAWEDSRGREA